MSELHDYIIYRIEDGSFQKVGRMLTHEFWRRRRWQARVKKFYGQPHRITRDGQLRPGDERVEILLVLHEVTQERGQQIEDGFARAYGYPTDRELLASIGRTTGPRNVRIMNEKLTYEQRQKAGRIGGSISIRKMPRETIVNGGRIGGLIGARNQPRSAKVQGARTTNSMLLTCPECGREMNPGNMAQHRRKHERVGRPDIE